MVAAKKGKGSERRKGKVGLAGGVKGKRGRGKGGEKGCFLGRKYGSINSSCFLFQISMEPIILHFYFAQISTIKSKHDLVFC